MKYTADTGMYVYYFVDVCGIAALFFVCTDYNMTHMHVFVNDKQMQAPTARTSNSSSNENKQCMLW
jgi:hypothetical protein